MKFYTRVETTKNSCRASDGTRISSPFGNETSEVPRDRTRARLHVARRREPTGALVRAKVRSESLRSVLVITHFNQSATAARLETGGNVRGATESIANQFETRWIKINKTRRDVFFCGYEYAASSPYISRGRSKCNVDERFAR